MLLCINYHGHFRAGANRSFECLDDAELGKIRIIRNAGRNMRLSVRTNGEIVLSAPRRLGWRPIEQFVEQSRPNLQRLLARVHVDNQFSDGDRIGRNHVLVLRAAPRQSVKLTDNQLVVTLSPDMQPNQRQQIIHQAVAKALKAEAQHYLPKRLRYLALKTGYEYQRVRLTYAKTRWGSCSSSGTISLNVALMQLPEHLSDYVLLHELTHTKHMNHGADFWAALEAAMPEARQANCELRSYSPYI